MLADAGDGYTVATVRLDAADYNVPQARERVFLVAVREDCRRPTSGNRPWLQHRRRRGRSRGLRCRITTPRATRSTSCPRQSPRRRPPTIQSTRRSRRSSPAPASGDGTASTLTPWPGTGRSAGRSSRCRRTTSHLITPRRRDEVRRVGARVLRGSRTTDRRLHPDQPAPTMTVSDGVQPIHYQGRSPSTPGEPVDDVRRLTVREVARLQTFPDMVTFAGDASNSTDGLRTPCPESRGTPHGPSPRSGARTPIRSLCRLLQYSNERHPSFRL